MGRFAGPYGVRGFARVQVFTETVDSLLDYDTWLVGRHDRWEARKVAEATIRGNGLVAQLEGVDSPEAARALRGMDIAVLRSELPPAEDDAVYWVDLIGCRVVNREGIELGEVTDLIETGSNDVLVVVSGSGEQRVERLVPYIAQVIDTVDLPGRRIGVDWGEDY